MDIPNELGAYSSRAEIQDEGAACRLTVYSTDPDKIKERLDKAGMTASFVVSIPTSATSEGLLDKAFPIRLATLAAAGL